MRGHSSTNDFFPKRTTGRLAASLLSLPILLSACEPDWSGEGPYRGAPTQGPGQNKLAISWTLGGQTMTEAR